MTFKKEVDTIKLIAKTNNVKLNIDRIVLKKLVSHILDSTTALPRDKKKKAKWIRIPYLGSVSHKISRLLKPFKINSAFYPLTTTSRLFSNLKDPPPPRGKEWCI